MTGWHSDRRFSQTAQKWRAFAERRRAAIVALYRSGRWKDLYAEAQFMALLREAVTSAETWGRIAPPPAGQPGIPGEDNELVYGQPHRTAA
jgi:hypothetical protein